MHCTICLDFESTEYNLDQLRHLVVASKYSHKTDPNHQCTPEEFQPNMSFLDECHNCTLAFFRNKENKFAYVVHKYWRNS